MSQFNQYSRQSLAHITYATGIVRALFVGGPQEVMDEAGRPVSTAIFKSRVEGPVMVRRLNLDGDRQADLKAHGGPDKAVYCYPAEHYEAWQSELGRELDYGTFGENLTVTGLLEDTLHVDDVIVVGDAVLQVSQPRFPVLQARHQDGRSGHRQAFPAEWSQRLLLPGARRGPNRARPDHGRRRAQHVRADSGGHRDRTKQAGRHLELPVPSLL